MVVSIHALTRRATASSRDESSSATCLNPRPHAEGDAVCFECGEPTSKSQSTPSRGGRRYRGACLLYTKTSQSTPSRGGRRLHRRHQDAPASVSIHALTRRATGRRDHQVRAAERSQSTPSRGGRLNDPDKLRKQLESQSTPSRGGRRSGVPVSGVREPVSIHALTRRATRPRSAESPWWKRRLNPRPHAEGDEPLRGSAQAQQRVSIHALTRRATSSVGRWSPVPRCLNPRPHAEGDTSTSSRRVGMSSSQSTPSRGGRRMMLPDEGRKKESQSTPSRGGRLEPSNHQRVPGAVSIHALTRRATRAAGPGRRARRSLNPRPHAEGDRKLRRVPSRNPRSQSTPSRGGRRSQSCPGASRNVSIHALTRRATRSTR